MLAEAASTPRVPTPTNATLRCGFPLSRALALFFREAAAVAIEGWGGFASQFGGVGAARKKGEEGGKTRALGSSRASSAPSSPKEVFPGSV